MENNELGREDPPALALAVTALFGFGVSKQVKNNVHHIDDRHILQPLGKHVANYDCSTSETSFLLANEGVPRIWHIDMSPNKAYAAVVQSVPGDNQHLQCAVYSLAKSKRARTLRVDARYSSNTDIQALAFSADGHLLVMATGEPDNAVLVWKWTTGKVLVAANSNFKLNFISLNPWDGTQLLCIGDDELNYMEFVEEELKLKADTPLYHAGLTTFCSHAWVRGTFIAVGTVTGQVGIFLRSEQRGSHQLMERTPIVCIAAHQSGFVTLSHSMLTFFAATGAEERPQSGLREDLFAVQHQVPLLFAKDIEPLHISIAPTGSSLIMSTSNNEILQMDLQYLAEMSSANAHSSLSRAWSAFGSRGSLAAAGSLSGADIEAAGLTPLATAFHGARVVCMDVCQQVPLIVTAAQDRELRLWNYATQECVLKRQLADDPLSIALHSTGLMLLTAFSDRVRLEFVLRSDLELIADFMMKKCYLCSFNNGGHLFAAVGAGNVITVYSVTTHQVMAIFKGHVSTIQALAWSSDDTRLASVGAAGACYQWDVHGGVKLAKEEYVDKQKNYCGVQFCGTGPANGVVVRSLDGKLQHIQGGAVVKEGDVAPGTSRGFALLGQGDGLLAATPSGAVSCHTWPLQPDATGLSELHEGAITHMALIGNGTMLVTISQDGIMLVSSVDVLVKGVPITQRPHVEMPPVHLMRNADLVALDDRITELKNQVKQIRIEYEYKLMLQPQQLNEQLREANLAKELAEVAMQERTDELNEMKANAESLQAQYLADIEAQHAVATEQLEAAYDKRFLVEHERVRHTEQAKDDLQFSLEEKVRKVDAAHTKILQDTMAAYDQKLIEAEQRYNAMVQQMHGAEAEYKEVLTQYDLEFEEKGQQMSEKLHKLREAAEFREVKLKGKNHILKSGHYRLKNELKQDIKQKEQLQEQVLNLESKCADLQVNITALREEISERESVIAQNYTTIQLLRRRLADMEKHRFVLGYRTQELEQELEPKEEAIENLNNQLQEQDGELVEQLKGAGLLSRGLTEQNMRIKSIKTENKQLRQQLADQASLWSKLQHDLLLLNGIPEGKGRRQQEIQRMMTQYCSSKTIKVNRSVEQEIVRQRDTAEVKAHMLKNRLSAVQSVNRQAVQDKVSENSALLKELWEGQRIVKELQHSLQREKHHSHTLQQEYDLLKHQVGAGARRQDPPGVAGGYLAPSLPGTSEGDRAIAGAPSLMAQPGTPGSPTRPQTALTRSRTPTTGRPQTAGPSRGSLAQGSTSRALNELVSEERLRVIELLGALTASSDLVEQQRCQIADLQRALQQRQQGEVSSDDADEEDIFNLPDQPLSPRTNLTRPSTARPRTAGTKQSMLAAPEEQPRLATPVMQSVDHQAAAKAAATAIGSRPSSRRTQSAAQQQMQPTRRHSYTMSAARGAKTSRPPSAGGTGLYFCNRDKYLYDYHFK